MCYILILDKGNLIRIRARGQIVWFEAYDICIHRFMLYVIFLLYKNYEYKESDISTKTRSGQFG